MHFIIKASMHLLKDDASLLKCANLAWSWFEQAGKEAVIVCRYRWQNHAHV